MGASDTIYNQIYNQASLSEMFDYYGIKRINNRYICPFHDDNHPSMTITKDDKIFTCWSCHTTGTIVDFVSKMEKLKGNNLSYEEVYKLIIDRQNLNIEYHSSPLTPVQQKRQDMIKIMEDAKNLSVNELKKNKIEDGEAYKYLQSRNISDKTIADFEIGYNRDNLLQSKLSNKYSNEDLVAVGVLSPSAFDDGFYDSQYNRLLIPIKNVTGQTVAFGGRTLDANTNSKYKNTKTTDIFSKKDILFNYNKAQYVAKSLNELIIVEGYFDAVSAWEMNMPNTVALMGTALTEEHIDLLKKLDSNGNVDTTLCLDNDDVGKKTMYELIPKLIHNGFNVNVIDIGKINKGKDLNDLLCAGISKEEIYKHKTSGFEYMLKYFLAHYVSNKGEINPEVVTKAYKALFSNSCFNNEHYETTFEELISKNSKYSRDDIKRIVHPECTLFVTVAKKFFTKAIKDNILKYAEKKYKQNPNYDNKMLLKYVNQNRVTTKQVLEGMNSESMLVDDNSQYSVQISKFCSEYLINTPDYKNFIEQYDEQFDKLLDNVYGLDKAGDLVQINLNPEQRDIITTQFNNYYRDEIKEYMHDHKERFMKLYVVDSIAELETLLGDEYASKGDVLSCMKEKGMSYINYGQKFYFNDLEKIARDHPQEYTTKNNDDFQLVLVYGNLKGQLKLKPENYKAVSYKNNDYVSDYDDIPEKYRSRGYTKLTHTN